MRDEAQLFFDIEVDEEARGESLLKFPEVKREREMIQALEAPPIEDGISSCIALQRLNKRLGQFTADQLYRRVRQGVIKGAKPTSGERSDGKASNAPWVISESSLDRYISRVEIEMKYGRN